LASVRWSRAAPYSLLATRCLHPPEAMHIHVRSGVFWLIVKMLEAAQNIHSCGSFFSEKPRSSCPGERFVSRVVLYRVVSCRIVSYRIVSYRIVSYCTVSCGKVTKTACFGCAPRYAYQAHELHLYESRSCTASAEHRHCQSDAVLRRHGGWV
jgi:hypothetical protein